MAAWLPLRFDLAAHILILGGSGSGKTRTARGLVRFIAEQRGERVVVLDPKANRDTWMGLPVLVRPAYIDGAMRSLLEEFQRRLSLNPTLTEVEAEQTFERVWVVVDEVSFVRDNCKLWLLFLRRISSMARSLKIHLVVVNQSERVEELGLRGRGDLLYAMATLLHRLAVEESQGRQHDAAHVRADVQLRAELAQRDEQIAQLRTDAVRLGTELGARVRRPCRSRIPGMVAAAYLSGRIGGYRDKGRESY